ncbi:MAG: DNRLRE domain-containing protein [Candidatus Micrarchaeota archaeon]|nr:DNRLRE domain-containing protein [Candidatus Micrarchaeota archaeon]
MSKKFIIPIILFIILANLAQAATACNNDGCFLITAVTGIGGKDYRTIQGTVGTADTSTIVKNTLYKGCFFFDPLSTSTDNTTSCLLLGNSAKGYGWANSTIGGNFPAGTWIFQTNTTSSNTTGLGHMGVIVWKNCSGAQSLLFGPVYNTTVDALGSGSQKIIIRTAQSSKIVNGCSLKFEYWLNVSVKGGSVLQNVTFGINTNNEFIDWPTLDGTAPTTTASASTCPPIDCPYTFGTWTNKTVSVTLTCSDGSGSGCNITKYCTDALNACPPSTTYTTAVPISTEGTSYIRYNSTDNAGNIETIKSSTIKIDTAAPTTTASAGTYTFGTWTKDAPVQVTLTCNDGGASGCNQTTYCNDTINKCIPLTIYNPLSTVPISTEGTSYIRYNSSDVARNIEAIDSSTIKIDTAAPTTTATAVKNNSASYTFNTWTNSTYVNVTLSCNDGSGSGCGATIGFCTDTTNTCTPSAGYGSPIQISTTGTSYIRYNSTDNAGNTETIKSSTIKIDAVAPTTTASAGSYTFGTWTNSTVSVTLSCYDGSGSGCSITKYCKDALDTCTPTTTYSLPVQISTTGISYIRYNSTDNAGNTGAINSSTIKIDTTAPAYSSNSTSSTTAGASISHNLYWQDSVSGLSGYVFRFCNGTWNGSTCSGYSCQQSEVVEIILDETNQGNVGDAYVEGGFGGNWDYNYGTSTILHIGITLQTTHNAFLLWNLSAIPPGATITEATMSLYMSTAPPESINIRAANTSLYTSDPKSKDMWVEGTKNGATNSTPYEITWTNHPDVDTYQGDEQPTGKSEEWMYFDVTEAAISSFAQENQNMSIQIFSTSELDTGDAEFASKEYDLLAGKRPQLTITYTTEETNPAACCGCANDTWVAMTGTGNWSNVTKVVNSSEGATIAWCVDANDTTNNWNTTSCSDPFTYMTTAPPSQGAAVSSDNTSYTACGAVFYKIRLYDQNSKLINSYFTLNILDPALSTVSSQSSLYPNNATGTYTSNYILNNTSLAGTWLLKVLESGGVTSGKNFYVSTFCGDKICAGSENCCSCPEDCSCGECSCHPGPPPYIECPQSG